jgi:uncharacterized protein YndB with AHSA1/START domain
MALTNDDAGAFFDPEPLGRITEAPRPTHDITHELQIDAGPSAVYAALTTHDGLEQWWPAVWAEPTAVEGGEIGLEDEDGLRFLARVDLLDPSSIVKLVHWQISDGPDEWPGTTVAFRIEGIDTTGDGRADAGTVVRFWHGGWELADGALPRASFGWAMALGRLRQVLAPQQPTLAP